MGTFSDIQLFRMLSGAGNRLIQGVHSPLEAPMTLVENWQRCYAKARQVKASESGSSSGAVRSHVRYLQHKDSHEHDDKLVAVIGDLDMVKRWADREQHYRLIIAPEYGCLLDMVRLARDVCNEAYNRYGRFEYAGAVHEKMQSNGRLNRHIHLIFKDTISLGANAPKRLFSTLGSKHATIQFERKGLKYLSQSMEFLHRQDLRYFKKELSIEDGDGYR
jgi:hypothetical protein